MSRSSKRNEEDLGAILFQDAEADLHHKPHAFPSCKDTRIYPLRNISGDSIMLGRAYNEPQGLNHIENILLQRDFIID